MAGHRNAKGFVLVATLWALAALALLASYINSVVATRVEDATEDKRVFLAELDRRNTEATVLYLLATGRMNHHSLILGEAPNRIDVQVPRVASPFPGDSELRVTGAAYSGLGGARFALQDEGGLISVNAPRFPAFAALLRNIGVPEEDIGQVVAKVEDYIDTDDFLTLQGAERHDYMQQGKTLPLNWVMSSPMEMLDVLGVGELIGPERWTELRPLLTMRPASSYNFNTMHPRVLAALLGLDALGVQGVLEEREKHPLSRLTQLAMLTGKHLEIDEMDLAVLPSNFLRLSVWHESVGPRTVVGIELTPLGETAPWRKDYRYSEPSTTRNGSGISSEPVLEAATPLLR
ncbi:MAG: type II secretion system protein GspK [Defluviicoccus sp.]|nr:type II secretion system protein GspK [Defluviicoccus sp.]MDE0278573.1 type II secretion system protein GspK [Defluviicoccus sp.]